MNRAKLTLRIAGTCIAVAGVTMLPVPQTNPEALTQSLFVWLATMGAFTRPGLILILVGVGCFAVAWVLPSSRE